MATRSNQSIQARRRAVSQRRSRRRPPRWLTPDNVERAYMRALVRTVLQPLFDAARKHVLEGIERSMRLAVQAVSMDSTRSDRDDDWLRNVRAGLRATRAEGDAVTDEARLERLLKEVGHDASQFNRQQWQKVMSAALGVDPVAREPWLQPLLDGFTTDNIQLIVRMKEDYLAQIERNVVETYRQGLARRELSERLLTELGQKLEGTHNSIEARARLIARDQIGKLNGQLTEVRQREVGVGRYIWRTSRDERVRDEHEEREGKVFSWDDPPSDGHPGEPIQCRCWAEPVIDAE